MEKRGLNPETAARLGVFTGKIVYGEEDGRRVIDHVDPADDGNILVFPIIEAGKIVGEKYRGPNKFFFQKPGSKQTFINGDILDDPSLHDGTNALTIVEGEPDLISAIDAGFPLTVSVPAGAPQPPKEKPQTEEQVDDSSGKYEFMWHNRERLKKIKRFIVAVDNDTNGKHLAEEIVRRLGASRCMFVTYPEGCKDLNDVVMKLGLEAATKVLDEARAYPLKGLYGLADYPDKAQIAGLSTGWPIVDTVYTPFAPSCTVVTGMPGSGKSTWLSGLAINMAELHGWKWAIFSPELPVVPHYRDKMRRIVAGESVERLTTAQIAAADRFINEHFVFIDYDVADVDDSDLTLQWLLDRTYDALMRHGIRGAIYDPWNEIEHAKEKWESTTEYTNRALRQVIKFGRRHGLATFILAHPTKDVGKDGKPRVPTLYDIDGCYSDDTEVLTRRGWLHHGQITMSDDVACFDAATGEVQYHQPERIIRREHDGEMYRFAGNSFDMLVTPEHRMVVKPYWEEPVGSNNGRGRPVKFEKGKWHFVEAKDMPNSAFWIPLAGKATAGAEPSEVRIGQRAYPIEPFLKLAGWYISEGHAGPTGITWSQGEGELAEQFTATFADAGIPAKVGWQPPQKEGWIATGRWYIGNRFCPALVQWFRDHCGVGSLNKRIPEAFFDLSPRLKQILLDAYLQGDGNKSGTSWRADTISRRLRDDLQRLAVELGVSTSSYESTGGKPNHANRHNIRFRGESRSQVTMRPWQNMSRENYKGLVWCLTVPTGAYFVRRRGYVMVSGNSAAFFNKPDFGIVVHRPDPLVDRTEIYVKKVRFEGTGSMGCVRLGFNRDNSRFEMLNQNPAQYEADFK